MILRTGVSSLWPVALAPIRMLLKPCFTRLAHLHAPLPGMHSVPSVSQGELSARHTVVLSTWYSLLASTMRSTPVLARTEYSKALGTLLTNTFWTVPRQPRSVGGSGGWLVLTLVLGCAGCWYMLVEQQAVGVAA
jgi:hypothetical protein